MKSLMKLLQHTLKDMSVRCGTDTQRDYITIAARVECEGMSFLTITLADFATDLERGLEQGQLHDSFFPSFNKVRKGRIPRLFSGIVSQVFDRTTGILLQEPSIECILALRQVCMMWKKIKLECSKERIELGFKRFKENEEKLRDHDPEANPDIDLFRKISACLWFDVLESVESSLAQYNLVPKHGPGATADRIQGLSKYAFRKWYQRHEWLFPFERYGVVNHNYLEEAIRDVSFLEPGQELPVKVVQVPKTLKGPRTIAMEPANQQWLQQSLLVPLVEAMESHPVTRKLINFRDQTLNAADALKGSLDGIKATLDLSDASDLVHSQYIHEMLACRPLLRDAVFATRSTTAELPSGELILLRKFASMGSALCFPMEAMFFLTLLSLVWHKEHSKPVSTDSVKLSLRQFRVYGDDIIAPVHQVQSIIATFEAFALKVNTKKTFWKGNFRESCGTDAYRGVDVTPVYVREMLLDDTRSVSNIPSIVSLANQLYNKGWWKSAQFVRDYAVKLYGPIPHVKSGSPGLGWISVMDTYQASRWCKERQAFLVKAYVVRSKTVNVVIPDYAKLLKALCTPELREEFEGPGWQQVLFPITEDDLRLERYARPRHVNIKRRWVQPY